MNHVCYSGPLVISVSRVKHILSGHRRPNVSEGYQTAEAGGITRKRYSPVHLTPIEMFVLKSTLRAI
jgi:hypothetical protein